MLDIIPRIRQGEDPDTVLSQVPPDSPFWKGVRYALTRDPYPYRYTLMDPPRHGPGVPDAVFEKFMDGYTGKLFSTDQTALAIGKISQTCTAEQWAGYIRPILERLIPFDQATFNRHAPAELRFPALRAYDPPLVRVKADLPEAFLMEPIYQGEPVVIFVTKNKVSAFHHDGRPFENEAFAEDFEALRTCKHIKADVVLDVIYEDDNNLILRDILALDQFQQRGRTIRFEERRKLLETVYYGFLEGITDSLELAECHRINSYAEALIQFNILLEQGFEGFYMRDLYGLYWDESDKKVVLHEQTELKLFALNSGPKGSNYENVVWSLEGTAPRKKLAHEVVMGLTASQRREIWENQQEYAGKKFRVSSCGVLDDGRLMFARFLTWRE